MKIFFLLPIFTILIFSVSCDEQLEVLTQEERLERDIRAIERYLDENNIDAQVDPTFSAVYYVIHERGAGDVRPVRSDRVLVSSDERPIGNEDATIISDSVEIVLGTEPVLGLQIGLQLLNEGDSATFYIPSGYAYGPRGSGRIGANTNLECNVRLLDIIE